MGKDKKGNAGVSTSGYHIPHPHEVDLDDCAMSSISQPYSGY